MTSQGALETRVMHKWWRWDLLVNFSCPVSCRLNPTGESGCLVLMPSSDPKSWYGKPLLKLGMQQSVVQAWKLFPHCHGRRLFLVLYAFQLLTVVKCVEQSVRQLCYS